VRGLANSTLPSLGLGGKRGFALLGGVAAAQRAVMGEFAFWVARVR
jgi:hypothetical protein